MGNWIKYRIDEYAWNIYKREKWTHNSFLFIICGILMSIARKGVVSEAYGDDTSKNINKWSVENMNLTQAGDPTKKMDLTWAYSLHYLTKEHFDYFQYVTTRENDEDKKI